MKKGFTMIGKMILTFTLIMSITVPSFCAENSKKDNISMYPQAQKGFTRYVIEVPKTQDDTAHRVELLIGKNMMVDCNHHSFNAEIKSVTLKGWGYRYLEVGEIKNGPTTKMACPQPKTEKFVAIRDALRRYNSRSPLVVYVQEGYAVRYRVWSAENTVEDAITR